MVHPFRYLIILCVLSLSVRAEESLEADKQTCTYSSHHTQSVSDSLQGCMNPGDKYKMNSYSEKNKSAHVTTTSGINEGQSGWVDLSDLASSIQDQQYNEMGLDTTVTQHPMNEAIQNAIASGKAQEFSVSKKNKPPSSDEDIWNGATGANPRYKLDADRYDGGDYIPFYEDSHDEFGTRTRRVHYVKADSKEALRGIARLTSKSQKLITGKQASYCNTGIHQTYTGNENGWIPSCEVLQNTNLTPAHKEQLKKCVTNMRAAINVGGTSRGNLLRNLYKKLNTREQEFAAMIFTAIGEARNTNNADRVMVMKTINNRARYAQEKGFSDANELDVALQNKQFSMYNSNDPNWSRALIQRKSDPAIDRVVKSYLSYRNTEFSEGSTSNQIYHYLTPAVEGKTAWVRQGKNVTPQVNNEKPSGHKFYIGVPWTFRRNNFRS